MARRRVRYKSFVCSDEKLRQVICLACSTIKIIPASRNSVTAVCWVACVSTSSLVARRHHCRHRKTTYQHLHGCCRRDSEHPDRSSQRLRLRGRCRPKNLECRTGHAPWNWATTHQHWHPLWRWRPGPSTPQASTRPFRATQPASRGNAALPPQRAGEQTNGLKCVGLLNSNQRHSKSVVLIRIDGCDIAFLASTMIGQCQFHGCAGKGVLILSKESIIPRRAANKVFEKPHAADYEEEEEEEEEEEDAGHLK